MSVLPDLGADFSLPPIHSLVCFLSNISVGVVTDMLSKDVKTPRIVIQISLLLLCLLLLLFLLLSEDIKPPRIDLVIQFSSSSSSSPPPPPPPPPSSPSSSSFSSSPDLFFPPSIFHVFPKLWARGGKPQRSMNQSVANRQSVRRQKP